MIKEIENNHSKVYWSPVIPVSIDSKLREAVMTGIDQCKNSDEEEGGVIIEKNGDFQFIKIKNDNTGTPIGKMLYSVNKEEYGLKVISKFENGWRSFASFHTHPTGCRAWPSLTDISRLFLGFSHNFIWSASRGELNLFIYNKNNNEKLNCWLAYPIIEPKEENAGN